MIKINQENCYVDKRKLVLDFEIIGSFFNAEIVEKNRHYLFVIDDWEDCQHTLKIDGQKVSFTKSATLLKHYKHCVQAAIPVDEDNTVFIDRRYEHNHSFDVYYKGKHYLVGKENL